MNFPKIKDTHMLCIQLACVGLGVLFLCLAAFVFMNKSQLQYVLPSAILGIVISIGPTFTLPLLFDVVIQKNGDVK